jgi:hypothetical protein
VMWLCGYVVKEKFDYMRSFSYVVK